MSARRLTPQAVIMGVDGHRMAAFPIFCGAGCSIRDGMPKGRWASGVPFEVYRKHFFHKGWELHHSDPTKDQCPRCREKAEAARRSRGRPAQPTQQQQIAAIFGAPQPYYQLGPSHAELKALQSKFSRRDPDNIKAEIKLCEQRLTRLRVELLPFEAAPKPALPAPAPPPPLQPQPIIAPLRRPRPPLHFWLERLRVKTMNP